MELLFLSLLVLVSGVLSEDQGDTVAGFLNKDVILECKCPNKVPGSLKWQIENNTNSQRIFSSNQSDHPKYKDRIESFEEEHNCSIRLKNITLDDSATYKCIFNNSTYQWHVVKLHVIQQSKSEFSLGDYPNPSIIPSKSSSPSRAHFTAIPAVLLLLLVVGYLYLHRKRNSAGTSTELV